MPTSAASCATAPRIRSTSAASAVSASGRWVSGVMTSIEPGLQDDLCGDLVAQRAIRAAAATGGLECIARDLARMALVLQRNGKREAAREVAGERARLHGQRVLGSVGVQRKADDQLTRLPLVDECGDR